MKTYQQSIEVFRRDDLLLGLHLAFHLLSFLGLGFRVVVVNGVRVLKVVLLAVWLCL